MTGGALEIVENVALVTVTSPEVDVVACRMLATTYRAVVVRGEDQNAVDDVAAAIWNAGGTVIGVVAEEGMRDEG